jgi:hypothetical protein
VLWELFFMLVVLKIPVVYLCAVVWWAIRAEPHPLEGAVVAGGGTPPDCGWRDDARRRRGGPRGSGVRGRFVGARRAALPAQARRVVA